MKQDLNGVRTAQDLERKYNLSGLSTLTKAVELQENSITKTNKTLEDFINVTTDNLKEIGNQEDEIITIWFYEGIPGNTKEPESSWLDYETKNKHKSDLYYDESTGKCYRYTYDDTYKWEEIVDSNVIESLGIANSHKDTGDNKRNIFLTQPIPPYEVGDIWIYKNKLYRCNIGRLDGDTFRNNDWIDATDYSDESASKNTTALLGAYKTLVNTKIITDSLLKIDGESVTIQVNGIDKKVDSKSKVFRTQPTTPYYEGDLYVTQNQVYVCVNKREEGTYISTDWELDMNLNDYTTTTELNVRLGEIEATISDVADMTTKESAETGKLEFRDINESEPINIVVHPNSNDHIAYLYPNNGLYPSNIYPKVRTLRFTNTTDNKVFDYELPNDLYFYDTDVYDIFKLDYKNNIYQVIKVCEMDSNGVVKELDEPQIINYTYDHKDLTAGNYKIELLGYNSAYLEVRLMTKNMYTDQFTTKSYLDSKLIQTAEKIESDVSITYSTKDETGEVENRLGTQITQTAGEINQEVSKKVGNTEVISKINLSTESATIDANKINIKGTLQAINNDTTTTINGNKITTGSVTASQLAANSITADKIKSGEITTDKINANAITSSKISSGAITADKISSGAITADKLDANAINGKTITGVTITSTSGTIGGWSLSSNGFTNGNWFIKNNGYTNVYTTADIFIIQMIVLGTIPTPQSGTPLFNHYDLNGDGRITIQDMILLQSKILGS